MRPTQFRAETSSKRASRLELGWRIFKFCLLLILIAWAYQRELIQEAFKSLCEVRLIDGAAAMCALGLTLLCGVARWRWILSALGFPQPTWGLGLRLYYEGLFYNTLAPGAIGGDLLRAHWLRKRHQQDSKIHYLVTLGERVLGLVTLGILGIYSWVGLELALAYCLLVVLVVLIIPRLIQIVKVRWPDLQLILPSRVARAPLYAAVVLNTMSHVISFTIYIFIGRSLGVELPLMIWFEILSVTVLAANIPLSVAGLGPREVALVSLLAQQGVSKEQALAISMGALATLVLHSLIGGLVHAILPATQGSDL